MKTVVICGSRRYKKEMRTFAKSLKKEGVVVYEPILNTNRGIDTLDTDLKRYAFLGLTLHQFEYLRKGDVVFIYNKDGYSGNSTTMELGYAVALGKPIFALCEDAEEPCRNVLFDAVVPTSKELLKYLV
jgi:nucleoside 2-deoxyribosyltransferase